MRFIVMVGVLSLLAVPASGQQVKEFQIVGFTTATTDGDVGVLGLSALCAAEFEASRVCSSLEAIRTAELPTIASVDWAWITASLQPAVPGSTAAPGQTIGTDASGVTRDPNTFSCRGWKTAIGADFGLGISPSGKFDELTCDIARPVACCALIPIPEPPTSMLLPSGALAVACLGLMRGGA